MISGLEQEMYNDAKSIMNQYNNPLDGLYEITKSGRITSSVFKRIIMEQVIEQETAVHRSNGDPDQFI